MFWKLMHLMMLASLFGRGSRGRVRFLRRAAYRLLIALALLPGLSGLPPSSAAAATPDFGLAVSPSSEVLAPGGQTSFTITVTSLDGFASPVDLSVSGLPSGVSGTISPNSVTPSSLTPSVIAMLTISAAANAPTGSFTVTVNGTGSGITHTSTGSVTLNFGLVPMCYGAFAGQVSDSTTGQPLAGVSVSNGSQFATTDASGSYALTNVPLDASNAPRSYNMSGTKDGYWPAEGTSATASCGQITTVNLQLVSWEYGSLSGQIVEGTLDANGNVVPKQPLTAIGGASINISRDQWAYAPGPDGSSTGGGPGSNQSTTSAADGSYAAPNPLPLAYNNSPVSYGVQVSKNGYWRNNGSGTVSANQNTAVPPVPLLAMCYATISGVATYQDTGLPASGLQAAFTWAYGGNPTTTTTDGQGHFSFQNLVPLGVNNSATDYYVSIAPPPGYNGVQTGAHVSSCGQTISVSLALPPIPANVPNYADLDGYVRDSVTGQPIANAPIYYAWAD